MACQSSSRLCGDSLPGVGPFEWTAGLVVSCDERAQLDGKVLTAECAVLDDSALEDREERLDLCQARRLSRLSSRDQEAPTWMLCEPQHPFTAITEPHHRRLRSAHKTPGHPCGPTACSSFAKSSIYT